MNVPLVQQVITEMETCQTFNPLSPGSWTRWIGMLQQAGEGESGMPYQRECGCTRGESCLDCETITENPKSWKAWKRRAEELEAKAAERQQAVAARRRFYTSHRPSTGEIVIASFEGAAFVVMSREEALRHLSDLHELLEIQPLAASSARAGSERQERTINAEANEYARMFDRIAKMHSFDLPMALLAELIGLFETALSRDAVPPASQQDEQLRANLKRLMASWRRTASQMPHDGHERYIRSVYAECADNLEVAIKPAASVPAVVREQEQD